MCGGNAVASSLFRETMKTVEQKKKKKKKKGPQQIHVCNTSHYGRTDVCLG